jgi:hypothetical protein
MLLVVVVVFVANFFCFPVAFSFHFFCVTPHAFYMTPMFACFFVLVDRLSLKILTLLSLQKPLMRNKPSALMKVLRKLKRLGSLKKLFNPCPFALAGSEFYGSVRSLSSSLTFLGLPTVCFLFSLFYVVVYLAVIVGVLYYFLAPMTEKTNVLLSSRSPLSIQLNACSLDIRVGDPTLADARAGTVVDGVVQDLSLTISRSRKESSQFPLTVSSNQIVVEVSLTLCSPLSLTHT